ncbi:adenosine kinase [Aureimonas jatrophae]|uniref:Sugar or nucleoside kinase, ribokinase family n=1 Tax=Aureimonas jatrophae TaxID=1166073 RepID=A0A1H0FMS2_9HYPH|nr:adenosine kinase [Aureimonas jatrophae]MBB3949937.1 sugar/nucleoside kinase (ribokinase family) [Aureimonas jatrophae]SDN96058.1 Sugar or nucleoside kinase, ribokinase family [Aureimonas jatrophae]
MNPTIDLLTIGNAIVDILARTDDGFLADNAIEKGAMTLVDAARASAIYDAMGPAIEMSGGSAGNTVAGLVSLGGTGAYIGKVAEDQLGQIFTHDIRSLGVGYRTPPLPAGGPPTARSMILVTPDGERSMNTHLGACTELGPEDVDEATVASARVTYFEGYLWDPPRAKDAILRAAGFAHAHGREVAMTLSDAFCVHRYRSEFLELMRSGTVDIVFSNEAEALALYETEDFDDAVARIGRDARRIAIVTRGAQGCTVVEGGQAVSYPATRVDPVVDTTGAGDLFAAGFLRSYTAGLNHARSARLGAVAAGHIIGQIGPRPQAPLADLPAAREVWERA